MTHNREEIINLLKQNHCEVTFTKVNGETRTMPCTLVESYLPAAKKDDAITQKKVREINPQVLSVWCTDKNSWRSFRLDNLLDIKIKND